MVKETKQPKATAPKRAKKRYEKPAVIHSQPLEAMALQCTPRPPGKSPTTGTCGSTYS